MRLYAVTDRAWVGTGTLLDQVEAALKGGATCIQLREKELSDEEFFKEALAMKELCRHYKAPLIINDRVELAVKAGADGVHVGQKDMNAAAVRQIIGSEMILGVSARTVEQAVQAQKDGADYLGVGAAFATSTKLDARPVSREEMAAICRAVDIPVCAIGGITRENLPTLRGTGVDGVALVSAVFASGDIETECRLLRSLSEQTFGQAE